MANKNKKQSKETLQFGRRSLMKLAVLSTGIGTTTAGTASVEASAQEASSLKLRTKGGQITEYFINGENEFEIRWNDVSKRGQINLALEIGIDGMDNDAIVSTWDITSDDSGNKIVSIEEFAEGDDLAVTARHPTINPDDISVGISELDVEAVEDADIYSETTDFTLTIGGVHSANIGSSGNASGNTGNASGNMSNGSVPGRGRGSPGRGRGSPGRGSSSGSENNSTTKLEDYDTLDTSIEIEPILGCGIYFGEAFGVTNSELPEEILETT